MTGTGELFTDLLDVGSEIPGLEDLFGLFDQVEEWSADIRQKVGLGGIDNLFSGREDKSDQIGEEVQKAVGGFDFGGLLQTATDLLGGGSPTEVPSYTVEFEKEGMRLTTGERIETQGIALDNLEQSLELELEADRLVTNTLEKSEHQHKVDQAYGNALLRESLLQMPFTP